MNSPEDLISPAEWILNQSSTRPLQTALRRSVSTRDDRQQPAFEHLMKPALKVSGKHRQAGIIARVLIRLNPCCYLSSAVQGGILLLFRKFVYHQHKGYRRVRERSETKGWHKYLPAGIFSCVIFVHGII